MEAPNTYTVREIKPGIYEIANFVDGNKEPHSVYKVKYSRGYLCDCPGYWRQKDKTQHKHCLIVKFWIEHLDKELGYALWFDGNDIEYHQFITKRLEKCLNFGN